jgi:hypothetical protein
MPQHELLAREDFAAAGEILSQALELFRRHFLSSPVDVALQLAQTIELGFRACDRLQRLGSRAALVFVQEDGLHDGRGFLQRVEPRLVHPGKRSE